jgi:hypothetical protein
MTCQVGALWARALGFGLGLVSEGCRVSDACCTAGRSWRCAGVSRRLTSFRRDGSGWLRAPARLEHGANLRKPPSVVNGATGGTCTRIHAVLARSGLSYGSGEIVEAAPGWARPLNWAWRRCSRLRWRLHGRAWSRVRRRCRRHAFQLRCHCLLQQKPSRTIAMVNVPPGIADCKTFFQKKAKKAYGNA